MNRDDAFRALGVFEAQLRARIPTDAPAKGRRYLGYVIDEQMAAARIHLTALYNSGLEIGPDFTELPACAAHPKYAFWCAGIRRHIQICEASLGNPLPHPAAAQ